MSPFHPTLWHLSHNLLDNNAVSAPRHWTRLAPRRPQHSEAPPLGGPIARWPHHRFRFSQVAGSLDMDSPYLNIFCLLWCAVSSV